MTDRELVNAASMADSLGDPRIVRCPRCGDAWCAPVGCDAGTRYGCITCAVRGYTFAASPALPVDVTTPELEAAYRIGGIGAVKALLGDS